MSQTTLQPPEQSGDIIYEVAPLVSSNDGSTFTLEKLDLRVESRFNKDLFAERVDFVIDATAKYDGALPRTWEKTQEVEYSFNSNPYTKIELNTDQQHEVELAASRLRNSGITSVVIEAAHTYMYESLDDPNLMDSVLTQCAHAAAATERLRQDDFEVRQMLFIDNYNAAPGEEETQDRLDLNRLIELADSVGYHPEAILWEADMVDLATNMIRFMRDRQNLVITDDRENNDSEKYDLAGSKKDSTLLLARRNIELYRGSDATISCSMLDAALTIVKLKHLGKSIINVLPRKAESSFSYKGQQEKMRTIIKEHLQVRSLPASNLFVDKDTTYAGVQNDFKKPR